MKLSSSQRRLFYVILSSAIGNLVQGNARIIQVPPNPLYAVSGSTVMFVWNYIVNNKREDFILNSPFWNYYDANGTAVNIGYDSFLRNWTWIINEKKCPPRLLYPTFRVSKESTATLVINNVTVDDSGMYGMILFLKTASPITSKTQLIVTTKPEITSEFQGYEIIHEGKDLNISCSATGTPTPNITWLLLKGRNKEIKTHGRGHSTLFIPNITRDQSGTYRCQATNSPNEYPIETETQVTVWYKPQMTMLNVSEEGNITIRIIATGKPNPLIRWYYPNVEKAKSVVSVIAGKTMTLEIPPDSVDLFGIFKFNLSNEVGWQVGYVNVTPKNGPTKMPVTSTNNVKTEETAIPETKAKTPITTHEISPKVAVTTKNGPGKAKSRKNVNNIVLLYSLGVSLSIVMMVSVVFVLRRRFKQRKNKERETDASGDINTRSYANPPGPSNIVNYAEVKQIKQIPVYAKVDMTKKRKERKNEKMPIYAQIDKRKKKRPGQVIYAELEEIKSTEETPSVILPPPYNTTEYADIMDMQNQMIVRNSEPIYETLPDIS